MIRLPNVLLVCCKTSPPFLNVQHRIEPQAGTWKPWVIPAAETFRIAPPSDKGALKGEALEIVYLHNTFTLFSPEIDSDE